MALPDSYTQKPGAIQAYFDAILNAQAPERFSQKFLENLGFASTNDRLFISILKDLGFLDTDGVPTDRYFRFHDRSQWQKVLAEGVREAFADLFAVNQQAHQLSADDVTNKLRTLYAGSKSDQVISRVARTFTALCEIADFSDAKAPAIQQSKVQGSTSSQDSKTAPSDKQHEPRDQEQPPPKPPRATISLDALQYHINIVLPESRDQAVYDAIFKSLRDHLG